MKETFRLMIENSFSTLIVLGSISFFVWVVAKYVPNPIDKIHAIFKILKHEGNPMEKKDWVERINWFSIVFFALLIIIEILLFGSSTILGSVLPDRNSSQLPSICLITLIFLCFFILYSPLLIIFTRGDMALKRKGKQILDS